MFPAQAWSWLGHGPALIKSIVQTREALCSCLEKGIEEVFVTAWGDNGNEASFMCILPVMQQYAEFCYQGNVSDEVLDQRLGGYESRVRTAIRRINLYLAGQIDKLEELEEERLTIDCRPNDEIGDNEIYCNNFWIPAFSASGV